MIYDPQVEVTCDNCGESIYIGLTPLAKNSYDERNVSSSLESFGWVIENDMHFCCEECRYTKLGV